MFVKGMIPWNKGKKTPIETLKKLSQARRGKTPWNKGKRLSPQHIEKLRMAKLGKFGELANNWKGGTSRDKHSLTNPKYKRWRMDIFLRDNFTCQFCGIKGIYLEPHHIKSWIQYPELRYDVENGVALCLKCHKLTDNYKNKK